MKGKPTKWTDSDIAYLKQNFPHKWNKDLAAHFNVGWRTVVRKARELGLQKAPDFRDNIDFTSFNKGISPLNKGMKAEDYMSKEGFEKSKLSQFKKGNIPPQKNNPNVVIKAWNTRRKKHRESLLKDFEIESALKTKHQNERIKLLKQEFK